MLNLLTSPFRGDYYNAKVEVFGYTNSSQVTFRMNCRGHLTDFENCDIFINVIRLGAPLTQAFGF